MNVRFGQLPRLALSADWLQAFAKSVIEYKNTLFSGFLASLGRPSGVSGVAPQMIQVMKQELALSPLTIRRAGVAARIAGPDLPKTAIFAAMYGLGGMLVYIAFRFDWIYAVAAALAVAHNMVVTVGLFSIRNPEINLIVVAAFWTLVGCAISDTIVIFDRNRENLKVIRQEKHTSLVNLSIMPEGRSKPRNGIG